MSRVEFCWDVASPYTYLALTQIDGLRQRTGAEVVFVPLLLGAVFKATGNQSPAFNPAKARFTRHDVRRWAEQYDIPMAWPGEVPFPINSLLPMRVATAADRAGAGAGERFCRAIFDTYWRQGFDVSQPEHLRTALEAADLDPDAMLEAATTQPVKDALRAATDQAVARGAFGAPAFFVGDELFWGNDRLHHVEAHLLANPR
jgi:2-hydroxychromene-2-carboxylate isomerase